MEEPVADCESGEEQGVSGHAVGDEAWDAKLGGGVEGPPEEAVGDDEADTWKEIPEGDIEVRFQELGGSGEGVEEGHGGELVGALDAGGDAGEFVREREGDDGGGGVGERVDDEGAVGGGGEEGDRNAAAEEEAG